MTPSCRPLTRASLSPALPSFIPGSHAARCAHGFYSLPLIFYRFVRQSFGQVCGRARASKGARVGSRGCGGDWYIPAAYTGGARVSPGASGVSWLRFKR